MVRTDLPLRCFYSSDAIQRETGRAATPNRWNEFNDPLKWEPALSGLRHFNALSLRASIKVVMTPCCLLLPIVLQNNVHVVIIYLGVPMTFTPQHVLKKCTSSHIQVLSSQTL